MQSPTIARVRLVTTRGQGTPRVETLARELPAVHVELSDSCGVCDAIVDCREWLASMDVRAFDEAVLTSSSDAISIRGACADLETTALEVLTRYQRRMDRRNAASASPLFDAVLRAHAALEPRAFDLGRDAWQWTLRLAPDAPMTVQVAALFHRAPDAVVARSLNAAGVDAESVERVTAILASPRTRQRDVEVAMDASSLAFLSLESSDFLDAHGASAARYEVGWHTSRMSRAARAKLAFLRLRPAVSHYLFESAAA